MRTWLTMKQRKRQYTSPENSSNYSVDISVEFKQQFRDLIHEIFLIQDK